MSHDVRTDDDARSGTTRRRLLQGSAAVALGLALPRSEPVAHAGATAPLSALVPVRAAMHVHASYSEGEASWEQQYANAAARGVHVLWQTDHNHRARALRYLTQLGGVWLPVTTGSTRQVSGGVAADGVIRLLVESASTGPATHALVMEPRPTAFDHFRTGIGGQRLSIAVGRMRLAPGARFELLVQLSLHPAQGGRPAGQYSVNYRFVTGGQPGRWLENGGIAGIVRAPVPGDGSTVVLTPETDIAALWPDMLAIDNCSYSLTFTVLSPRTGAVADVTLRSVTVGRPHHDAASVQLAQVRIAARYSARHALLGIPSEEVSWPGAAPHCNVYGAPPEWAYDSTLDWTNWRPWYRDMIRRVHARGGVVSLNHPFGAATTAEFLPPAEQTRLRRARFAALMADDLFATDVLEVGYASRGGQPFVQHLGLWDTFSRHGRWLTGNGVTDDHSGKPWDPLLRNSFVTGVWAPARTETAVVGGLAAGRAFAHDASVPRLELDTLTDGTAPMGAVSVSDRRSRRVAIGVSSLPDDATVELVRGPVDRTGDDPATAVVASLPAASFAGDGVAEVVVDTATACFIRPQVRQGGGLRATGNPTWLLRSAPPGGIPPARDRG